MDIQTIIFDLDGTLCDYTITIEEAMRRLLPQCNVDHDLLGDLGKSAARYNELWSEEEAKRERVATIHKTVWLKLLQERGQNDQHLALCLAEVYLNIRLESLRIFDGTRELLERLRHRFRLGLITNGPSDMQWAKIDVLKIKSFFDEIIVAGDIGIYKPDERIFKLMLQRLDTSPQHALYIGDSLEMDVAGAKQAGLHTGWINPHGKLAAVHLLPDFEVRGPAELWEVLQCDMM
ncbi:HAD family hydrolase [Candidatus Acetothermia bacterium]|jgi:2-haloalkanoic acid dehalogenase type II|nr:HAD family hydrolase [Candidatus Acetothermia bacterium]MCI2427775.1 HAD family hydrolase [Candidatus Acetothermia bacterium]